MNKKYFAPFVLMTSLIIFGGCTSKKIRVAKAPTYYMAYEQNKKIKKSKYASSNLVMDNGKVFTALINNYKNRHGSLVEMHNLHIRVSDPDFI